MTTLPSFTGLTRTDLVPSAVDTGRAQPFSLPRRVARLTGLLIALYFAKVWLFHYGYLGSYMFKSLEMNDFGKFYYSAKAFLHGGNMYGPSPATAIQVSPTEVQEFLNLNPPHFHVVILPLAMLPPAGALLGWVVLNVLALAVSVGVVLRALALRPTQSQVFWAAFCTLALAGPLGALVVTGQLTWLLTAVITIAWARARNGDWLRAAGWLGVAVSVKPFLATLLLVPMMRRDWRALTRAILSCAACGIAGWVVFGADTYREWLGALGAVSWPWPAMNMSLLGWLSRTFDTSVHFSPVWNTPSLVRPLWLALSLVVAAVTLRSVIVSERGNRSDHSFAALILMALLVSPLGWVYYLWLAVPPLVGAALVHRRRQPLAGRMALGAVAVGFACPLTAIPAFSENGWLGTGIGSIYFWSALVLWGCVVSDAFQQAAARTRGVAHVTDQSLVA